MIIGRDLMVQLVLISYFKRQFLQWDGATVPMKEPSGMLEKSDLNNRNLHKVVMQTSEPASTREATERLVKSLAVLMLRQTLSSYPITQPS